MKKIVLFVMLFIIASCSMGEKEEDKVENNSVEQNEKVEQKNKTLTTEEKIGKLQMFLYDNVVKKYIDQTKKYSNSIMEGNLNANYNANFQGQDMSASMSLKDYILKRNSKGDILFNGLFSWNISSMFKKVNIETKFDMVNITNLESFFIKLEGTSFTGYKMIEDKLSMIENSGKHVSFDYGSDNFYQEVNYKAILEDFEEDEFKSVFKENWLKVYKKEGDKEYLIPTNYIISKIASYIGEEFNKEDYSEFVEEYDENMEILPYYNNNEGYLSIMPNNDRVKKEIKEDFEKFEFKIYIDENNISKIDINIVPDQEKYKGDGVVVLYESKNNLDISFNVSDAGIDFEFTSKLDENNRFENIDGSFKYEDDYEPNINGNIKLKDNKLNISSIIEGMGTIKINGTTDNENKLETINGNMKFMMGYVNLKFDINIKDNTQKVDFNVAENVKFNLDFENNNGTIDFNMNESFKVNFKKENEDNFSLKINGNNTFNMNEKLSVDIKMKDGKITGKSVFNIQDENIVYITNNGEYKENSFMLETSGKVNIGGIIPFFPYNNILFKNNIETNSKDNMENYDINGSVFVKSNDELLGKGDFNINGNHNVSYKDNFITIYKPENYISFEELNK